MRKRPKHILPDVEENFFMAFLLVAGPIVTRLEGNIMEIFRKNPNVHINFQRLKYWMKDNNGETFTRMALAQGYRATSIRGAFHRYLHWYYRLEAIRANANDEAALPKVSRGSASKQTR